MKTSGSAHSIVIEKTPNRVTVTFNGKVFADTQQALILREGPLPPVLYLPRTDVEMSLLQPTKHTTHCPFRGMRRTSRSRRRGKVRRMSHGPMSHPFQLLQKSKITSPSIKKRWMPLRNFLPESGCWQLWSSCSWFV